MKKLLFLIFLLTLIFIYDFKENIVWAQTNNNNIVNEICKGGILDFINPENLLCRLRIALISMAVTVANFVLDIVRLIVQLLITIFFYILAFIAKEFAFLADTALNFNPFSTSTPATTTTTSTNNFAPATIVWRTIRDLAYIALVFVVLYIGFLLLFEGGEEAKGLIFNIILVAFLINFSYAFVQLGYFLVDSFERGLSGGNKNLGSLLLAAFWSQDPLEESKKLSQVIANTQIQGTNATGTLLSGISQSEDLKEKDKAELFSAWLQEQLNPLFSKLASLGALFFPIGLIFVINGFLFTLLILVIFRFFKILILAGTSSFAFASLAFPQRSERGGSIGSQFVSSLFSFFKPGYFANWLRDLVNWLLVIPAFYLLILLGIVIFYNINKNLQVAAQASGGFSILANMVFSLFFIGIWFVMSLNIATNMAGNIARWAFGVGTGISSALTAGLAKKLGHWALVTSGAYQRIGGLIEGAGGAIKGLGNKALRIPVIGGYLGGALSGLGYGLEQAGSKLKQKTPWEGRTGVVEQQMENIKNLLTKGRKDEAYSWLSNLITPGNVRDINFAKTLKEKIKDIKSKDLIGWLATQSQNNELLRALSDQEIIEDEFIKKLLEIKVRGQINPDDIAELIEKNPRLFGANFDNINNFLSPGQTWEDIIKNIIDTAPTDDKVMDVLWAIYFHTTLRGQTKQTATLAETVLDPQQNYQNIKQSIRKALGRRATQKVMGALQGILQAYDRLP
ncbi:MAG: hypothetical protein C4348_02035 [Patescibacteria group bacterium]